jgi:hypothetical protein
MSLEWKLDADGDFHLKCSMCKGYHAYIIGYAIRFVYTECYKYPTDRGYFNLPQYASLSEAKRDMLMLAQEFMEE